MAEISANRAGEERRVALEAVSRSLSEVVATDPEALARLDADGPLATDYGSALHAAGAAGGLAEIRRERRRRLAELAARDAAGEVDLVEVGRALSDLADATIAATMSLIGPAPDGFAVIAMGKLGGRELNYSSDIDLMFVAEGDADEATRYAGDLVTALSEFTPEGQAYRVDLNLRPEGRSGALVRSLDGYLEYYKRWAKQWEFQALIKARACTGDEDVGLRFVEATRPFVFESGVDEERVAEIRRMKERVESHAAQSARKAGSHGANDVKLGPGGIRDIEFSVQLLQLVHGGNDPSVRSGNTLEALAALVEGGYIAEEDGAGLEVAYRWLRNVEHRLQLWQERQTHHLPDQEDALARLARSMGFTDSPSQGAADRFREAHRGVLGDVRGRFEKLFYRPMVESLADSVGPRLSEGALKERLHVLGFRDVDKAARNLQGLVAGSSRRAKLLRVLTVPLLRSLAETPQPDTGLFAFLRLGEALQDRLDVLGSLRDNPPAIAELAKVLGSGRVLGEVLVHVPEEIAAIASMEETTFPSREVLVTAAHNSLGWRGPEGRLDGLRRFKRRGMMRIAIADVAGGAGADDVGAALTDLAEACLEAALNDAPLPFAVIAMGKLGGRELQYSSDLDVMFIYEGDPKAGESVAEELMRSIGEVTPEGQAFKIDAGLRPEGKSGSLARSLDAYLDYYDKWADPWEHQALIKARVCAGDYALGERLVQGTRRLAFPERLSQAAVAEIRHLKARMEKERIPRGTDPRRNLKLGPGGLSDIEFAAQMLQLQHAHHLAFMQVPGTAAALDGARVAEVISEQDALRLTESYLFLSKLRNRMFFIAGRPVDALPAKPEDLEALGISMGFTSQPRQELEDEFLRMTRRSRIVCERVVYGGRGTASR